MELRLLVHPPAELAAPGDWDPAQRDRLNRLVRRAVRRAAAGIHAPGLTVEIVADGAPDAASGSSAARWPGGQLGAGSGSGELVHERLDDSRLGAAAGQASASYGVPSFGDGSQPATMPVQGITFSDAEAVTITTGGPADPELLVGDADRVVREKFPRATVIQAQGNRYFFASGSPYVVASNLARAVLWGQSLFGGSGFAIFQPNANARASGSAPAEQFYVVGLERPLRIDELDGLDEFHQTRRPARIVSPANYTTVAVTTAEGNTLFRRSGRGVVWDEAGFRDALARIPGDQATLDPTEADLAAGYLIRAAGSDAGTLALIINMNRTMFAAMPWETRASYLALLTRGGVGDREKRAIMEIIQATRTTAELEAVFALLRAAGAESALFAKLDSSVFSLLQYLGEFRPAAPVSWRYLVDILVDSGVLPGSAVQTAGDPAGGKADALREASRLAEGVKTWISGIIDSVVMLVSEPEKIAEGLAQLPGFVWTLQKAQLGDPESVRLIEQLMRQGAAAALQAIRGLEYAEVLGTSYGSQSGGNQGGAGSDPRASHSPSIAVSVGGDILAKLKWLVVLEVLSWFVGIGEIRAAIGSLELGEKLTLLLGLLRSLRFLGGAGEAASEAARLERVLVALGRLAEIAEATRLARAAELLPEGHLALLGRLAKAADLPPGAGVEALRLALKGDGELLAAVDRLGDALAVAGRLEARAVQAGGLTPGMTAGLRTLLTHSGLERAALTDLIEHIPAGRLDEYLHALQFARPEHLGQWGAAGLRELAEHPRALLLLREGGSDLFGAVRRRAANWEETERIIDGLALRRDQIGDPAQYQRLLDRLSQGDPAAFTEATDALHAQRLAEASRAGNLAQLGLARLRESGHTKLLAELQEIAAHNPALLDQRASQLARLTDRELTGLEQIARLESERIDWGDALDALASWSASDRADLLGLIGDVGPHAGEGFESVIRGILGRNSAGSGAFITGVQGSWGQLYAAKTLVGRGARNLRFEIMEFSGALRRDVDIIADINGRSVRVEVKTNLQSLGSGGLAQASADWGQIGKDLANHASTGYQDLLYMYHPSVQGQLPGLGQRMLELFGGPGRLPDPSLVARLTERGVDVNVARASFQRWLANGGLTTYGF